MQSLAGSLQGAAADSHTRLGTAGLKRTWSAVRLYRLQANTLSRRTAQPISETHFLKLETPLSLLQNKEVSESMMVMNVSFKHCSCLAS